MLKAAVLSLIVLVAHATTPVPEDRSPCPTRLGEAGRTMLMGALASLNALRGSSPEAFLQRFPKVSYLASNYHPEATLIPFFRQLFEMDFSSPGGREVSLHFYLEKKYRLGWRYEPSRRANIERWAISRELEEGWRALGWIRSGKFQPHVSLHEIRKRFERLTGWKTISIHPIWHTHVRQNYGKNIGAYRREQFLSRSIVLDDLADYVFFLPLLTDPIYRERIHLIGSFERVDYSKMTRALSTTETCVEPTTPESVLTSLPQEGFTRRNPDTILLSKLLSQEPFGDKLYSLGPLIAQRSEANEAAQAQAAARAALDNFLEKCEAECEDQDTSAWLLDYRTLRAPLAHYSQDGPGYGLEDHVSRALALHIFYLLDASISQTALAPQVLQHLIAVAKILRARM